MDKSSTEWLSSYLLHKMTENTNKEDDSVLYRDKVLMVLKKIKVIPNRKF